MHYTGMHCRDYRKLGCPRSHCISLIHHACELKPRCGIQWLHQNVTRRSLLSVGLYKARKQKRVVAGW